VDIEFRYMGFAFHGASADPLHRLAPRRVSAVSLSRRSFSPYTPINIL